VNSDPSNANVVEAGLVQDDRSARLSDFGLFFSKFMAKGRQISSAVPSSPAMVARILDRVDFSRPGTIVELGAGTGPVTEQIMEVLRPHHRFIAVENDPDFCNILRRRFPNLTLLQSDATKIAEPLEHLGVNRVEYVLSGLPTPALPRKSLIKLIRWLEKSLSPTGVFIQITVVPFVYQRFYRRLFDSVDFRMVWLNIPPGGVYYCSKPRRRTARAQ